MALSKHLIELPAASHSVTMKTKKNFVHLATDDELWGVNDDQKGKTKN